MHWVVNTSLKREGGYEALIDQLDRQKIEYTLVRKPPFADYLVGMDSDEPIMLEIEGPVFVTGTTSMNMVSQNHGWQPGYLDSPGIIECIEHWGEHMLNHDLIVGTIADIEPIWDEFFIRPDLDSKSFSGTMMSKDKFNDWRKDLLAIDTWTTIPASTQVIMSSLKVIWSEYRCSVVDGRVVTASRYKTGRTVAYSSDVGDRIINFAKHLQN